LETRRTGRILRIIGDRSGTIMNDAQEVRDEGFYWVILGQNPPKIAYSERGEWWLAGDTKPWHADAVTAASDRLIFLPRLTP
jgi:hypothetical protein